MTSAFLMLLAVAGCSLGSESKPSEPSSSPPQASSPPSAKESARAVYEDMWGVVADASREGETDPERLDTYAEGQALALMRQALENAKGKGPYSGEPELNPEVISLSPKDDPTTAKIEDCADDSAWAPKSPGQDSTNKPRRITATVRDSGLEWRVSKLRILEQGSC